MASADVSRLMAERPTRPILMATDPKRMVAPLLRRPTSTKPSVGFMSETSRRRMRLNLLSTRLALRIRLLEETCLAYGTVFVTPGHEGTSRTCPRCTCQQVKDLRERVHDCPCGFVCGRDHASALVTLGRALRPFQFSPDPDGAIARAIHEREEKAAKVSARRERIAEGRRKYVAKRRESSIAGAPPGKPGRSAPGPSVAVPKRVRGQGRNVRSFA